MLSPSSAVASCPASSRPTWSAPTAAAMALSQCAPGNCQSGLPTNAAVGVPWVLSTTKVRPGCITASVYLCAVTMASQPSTRSALAVSTLVVWMASGRLAIWMWLQVAPPFCARPPASCVITPLPSRCAAMPSREPMAITPVPPPPPPTLPPALWAPPHPHPGADGDHASAAHAPDHDAPGAFGRRQHGLGQRRECRPVARATLAGLLFLLRLPGLAALHRDEARAKTVDAAVVFVATALVDAA